MSNSCDESGRTTSRSPLDRLSFIVPLLHRDSADSSEDEGRRSTSSRVAHGFLTGSTLMALCTGFSFATCKLMADPTYAAMTISSVADNSHLKVLGLRRHSKSWKEYSQEMVDYISSRSYSALAVGEIKTLDPLLSSSFSHFPDAEHGALGLLLPDDVQQWADVHWTIAYTQFMEAFGLDDEYAGDESLILSRFNQYRRNGALVYQHNKKSIEFAPADEVDYLYTLELNRFADLSNDDMAHFGYVDTSRSSRQKPPVPDNVGDMESDHFDMLGGWPFSKDLPEEFNWKADGCVQKVKNQLHCGSCWAFSAVESLESAVCVARKHKKGLLQSGPVSPNDDDGKNHRSDWVVASEMPNLSEQQLVDCAQKDGNHGCHGGMMEFAFQYTMENSAGELCDEDSYDYQGVEGKCLETKCKYDRDWKVVSWNNVTRFSESSLQKAILNYGTIAVSVEADNEMFMFYKGGIVHDGKVGQDDEGKKCGDSLNHGVAVVGWGTDTETKEPYWLVKNSWGPTWGESGFIRLARDSGGMFGECGILMDASYPIIKVYAHPSH